MISGAMLIDFNEKYNLKEYFLVTFKNLCDLNFH